jgi:hypothetical protein
MSFNFKKEYKELYAPASKPSIVDVPERFIKECGYRTDIKDTRRHHEIYLEGPRKVQSEKLKTIIRHPIVKGGRL